ncbi:hypothetical protein N9H93_01540 [Rhizobiaceae bacterium]|nr:hypothetical protein [Rhizobiaceae bacterium]
MSTSSARALDDGDLQAALNDMMVADQGFGSVAANTAPASPEDVDRIRRLIEETSRTVAKFRQLVVANAEGGEVTMDMLGEYRAASEVIDQPGADPATESVASAVERVVRPGVLWSAALEGAGADRHRMPLPGRAELQARRRDEKDGKPDSAPLASGESATDEDDETQPDFFTLRRSLRYLQFRHQIGAGYTDEVKNEYSLLLEALAEASVQYDALHRSTSHHREATDELDRVRKELDVSRTKCNELAAELETMQARLTTQTGAHADLTAQLDKLREEQEQKLEALTEQRIAFEADKKERGEAMSLLVAETSILRNALSDACDTIAEDMSRRLGMENRVQELEDRLAARSPGARKLEGYVE